MKFLAYALALGFFQLVSLVASAQGVKITDKIESVTIKTPEGAVEIKRNQNPKNTINPIYAKTSRKCPPFCIQPMEVAPGVKTVGALEVLNFLEYGGLVIDARTVEWHSRGSIPGAKSIPFFEIANRLDELGCKKNGKWDCSKAKQVILFCNGAWCDQSPTAIREMIGSGYPSSKILYFRNGMQGWESFGLTVTVGRRVGQSTDFESLMPFVKKQDTKLSVSDLREILFESLSMETMMVPPSDTTQSTSPSVPKSSRSTCGEIPKVAWWGNPTHEKIISQVNKKHSSNWDEYIGKWQKQLSFLKEVKGKGGTIVTPIQTRLKGMALDQYIQQVSTRVKVIKCLKLENT